MSDPIRKAFEERYGKRPTGDVCGELQPIMWDTLLHVWVNACRWSESIGEVRLFEYNHQTISHE